MRPLRWLILFLAAELPLLGQSLSYPNFSNTSGLQINGSAAAVTTSDGVVLRITPAQIGQAGSFFSTALQNFQAGSDSFSTFFQFRVTNIGGIAPADGFVFVIQTEANNVGGGGSDLGYGGIAPSVGVEFDTFQNTDADFSNNHVAILTNGNVNSGAGDIMPTDPYGVNDCAEPVGTFGCLANGDLWSVWIDYDGTSLHIAVADNSTVRPQTNLIDYAISIPDVLDAASAFVGFTGATGSGWENHDIVDWQFRNTYAPITGPVGGGPQPPLTPPPAISGNGSLGEIPLGGSISATFTASGGTPPYTWSANGLPRGFTFSQGSLKGTPTQAGAYSFFVQLTDSTGQVAIGNVTFSVLGITTTSLASTAAFVPYSATVAAAGGTQPYSFSAAGLPPGLQLSAGGTLSGTPTRAGNYSMQSQVTDAEGVSETATLALTVGPAPALSAPPVTLPSGTVGISYSQTVGATGGQPAYSWSVAAGTPPPGLTFNSNGVLFGTPPTAGSYAFSARATDSSGASAVAAVSVVIASPALIFQTTSPLSSGMVSVSYPAQIFIVLGGIGPYTFAVTAGALPAGLSLSSLGLLAGTPTAAGTGVFTVTAADSAKNTASAQFQLTVRAFAPDLILSSGSLSFSLPAGATSLPPGQSIQVQSSVVNTILPWSVAISPAVSWLKVTPASGSTPGAFTVSLASGAPSLSSGGSPYQANIAATCSAPAPCAGNTQNVTVTLNLTSAPPQLTALPNLLPFNISSSGGSITLQNSGGGTIGIASVSADAPWVSISNVPQSLSAGASAQIGITTNSVGMPTGFYRSTVTVNSSAGSAAVPVTLFVSSNASLALEPQGQQFQIAPGGIPGPPVNSILIDASTASPINWSAMVVPGAPWLSVSTPGGTSTLTQPGAVSYSINLALAASLAPGAYYGRIEITAAGIADSPLDFEVVLNVASNSSNTPTPYPEGLLFISSAGNSPPPQTVQVFANSPVATAFQASPSTASSWLSVSPATGSANPGAPAQTTVSVNNSGLTPGVYYGGVSYAFANAGVRTVNVTLLVAPAGAELPQARESHPETTVANCTPSQLVPASMGPLGNFAAPAAWPVPISIQLLDNCSNPINGGTVIATFSNGDPPLPLSIANGGGLYVGTWTPRNVTSQITVNARASSSGFPTVTAQVLGSVAPNNAPLLAPGGILNAFADLVGGGLAPGTIVQVYGSYLASQTGQASSIPLPTAFTGTSLIIGGIAAPLYFTSTGQINAQIPFELTPGNQYQVIGSANGALTTPETIQLTPSSPGLAAFPAGTIIAQHADGSLVSEISPAKPGEYLVAYVAGFGATTVTVSSGVASPTSPLAQPVISPSINIASQPATILFAGLTPGLVGLYQINFQVPSNIPNGDEPLILSQGGVAGNATILPVHN